MSCLHPITIKNPKADYISGVDAVQLSVPCGKCIGCQKDLQNEWFVRNFYQWKFYQEIGGCTMFITLTYNEEHLPHIEIDGVRYPCFSRMDIQQFLNTLRQKLKRKYGIGEKGSIGMTYFIASEFGGKYGRPHYHGTLNFPPADYTYRELMDIVADAWKKRGFIKYSNKGAFVEDPQAIMYASKYAGKDLGFINQPHIQKYLEKLRDEAKGGFVTKIDAEKVVEEDYYCDPVTLELTDKVTYLPTIEHDFKERSTVDKWFLPRHYQSKGFGKYLYEMLKNKSPMELYKDLYDGVRLQPTDNYLTHVPRYIRDKFLYTTSKVMDKEGFEHDVRKLSEFGQEYTKQTFEQRINDSASVLEKQVSFLGLTTALPTIGYANNLINTNLRTRFNFGCMQDLSDFLKSLMENLTFRDVALYKALLKGRVQKYSPDEVRTIAQENACTPLVTWTASPLADDETYKSELTLARQGNSKLDLLFNITKVIYADHRTRKAMAKFMNEQKLSEYKHKLLINQCSTLQSKSCAEVAQRKSSELRTTPTALAKGIWKSLSNTHSTHFAPTSENQS